MQIFAIHGGTSAFAKYEDFLSHLKNKKVDLERFKNYLDWKGHLPERLGKGYEVIFPRMPNRENACYEEWKIWFEKFIPFMEDGVVLIGHSLGAIFLAKYLSENDLPKKIRATFLVAAPYDVGGSGSGARKMVEFELPATLDKLQKQGGEVYFYHSKNDPIVSFNEFAKYQHSVPGAHFVELENRGHFDIPEFPEIVETIRGLK